MRKKSYLSYLLVTLVAFILLLCLIPTFLSHGLAVRIINSQITGRVEAKALKLTWFSKQSVDQLKLFDSQNNLTLSLDKAMTNASLFDLISKRPFIKDTVIQGCYVNIIKSDRDENNLINSINDPSKKELLEDLREQYVFSLPFIGNLDLEQAHLCITIQETDPVEFQHLNLRLSIPDINSPLHIDLSSLTRQGDLRGSLKLLGNIEGFNAQGKLLFQKNHENHLALGQKSAIQLKARMDQVPVASLDYIVTMNHSRYQGTLLKALGDLLTCKLDLELEKDRADLDLYLESPNLKMDFKGKAEKGIFQLERVGTFVFNTTPEFIHSIAPNNNINLVDPSLLTVVIDRFSLPLLGNNIDISHLSINMQIFMENALVKGCTGIERFSLEKFKFVIDSLDVGNQITCHMQSTINDGYRSSFANGDGYIANLYQSDGTCSFDFMDCHFISQIQAFPSALLQSITQELSYLELDPYIDININATGSRKTSAITLSVDSEHLKIEQFPLIIHNFKTVDLKHASDITFSLNPFLANKILQKMGLMITNPSLLHATLERLHFTLPDKNAPFDWSSLSFIADIDAGECLLQTPQAICKQVQIHLNASVLTNTVFQMQSKLVLPENKLLANNQTDLFIQTLPINLMNLNHQNIDCELYCSNPNFELKAKGEILAYEFLAFKEPLLVKYIPSSELSIQTNSDIQLSIDPFELPLQHFSYEKCDITGTITAPNISITHQSAAHTIEDFLCNFDIDGSRNQASFHLSTTTSTNGCIDITAVIDTIFQEQKLTLEQAAYHIQGRCKDISSSFVQPYQECIGNIIDLEFDTTFTLKPLLTGTIDFHLKTPLMNLTASLNTDTLALQSKIDCSYCLTPKAFTKLHPLLGYDNIALLQDTNIFVSIDNLTIPSSFKTTNSLQKGLFGIKADILCDQLAITERSSTNHLTLKDLQLTINTLRLKEDASLSLNATLPNDNLANGTLVVEAQLQNLLNPQAITGTIDCRVEKASSLFLDKVLHIACQKEFYLPLLLGSIDDLHLQGSFNKGQGPLFVNIDTSHLKGSLDLYLNHSNLILNKKSSFNLNITKEFSKKVLKNINPLLVNTISSQDPILLTIYPEGFLCPLSSFHLNNIKIPHATIDLGRLTLQNGSGLSALVNFLRMNHLSQIKEMTVWCNPFNFQFEKGTVYYDRVDFLVADEIHCAAWGSYNCNTGVTDMMLGLTPNTLYKAFGIKKLPANYLLLIPMKDSSSNLQINWGASSAQIAGLITKEFSDAKGNFLGNILTLSGLNDSVIPPAHSPLPWETIHTKDSKIIDTHDSDKDRPLDRIFQQLFQTRSQS